MDLRRSRFEPLFGHAIRLPETAHERAELTLDQSDRREREDFHAGRRLHGLLVHFLGRDEEGDGWAALSRSRVTKGHVFDEVAQLHKRREMEGLDKGAVGPQREGLRPIPGISGAGDDHDADVRALGDRLDMP